jgi:copper chaperone CopZ
MKEVQFKTNLNCGGCVSKVKADLDANKDILEWKVDTENPNKILTVKGNDLNEAEVVKIIQSKGFTAEQI